MYDGSIGKWPLAHHMARFWANVSQQWVVTSYCNNCCTHTVLSAMLTNNYSAVHPRVLRILSWSSSRALAQHSVIRTKNFSTRARPAPAASTTRTRPAPQQIQPAPKALRVPPPAPQMRVTPTRAG